MIYLENKKQQYVKLKKNVDSKHLSTRIRSTVSV